MNADGVSTGRARSPAPPPATPTSSPFVQATTAKTIKVKLDRKVLYEIDGGDRDKVRAFDVKVEPGAVTVCLPASAARSAQTDGHGGRFDLDVECALLLSVATVELVATLPSSFTLGGAPSSMRSERGAGRALPASCARSCEPTPQRRRR